MTPVLPSTRGALLEAIAGRGDELAALTAALIRCPSPNPPGDERAVVAEARRALEALDGVACRIVEPAPARQSLIAVAGPAGGRTLLLGAHLDTVPAGDGWQHDPFAGAIEGDAVYGRGASDNKGAAAAMIVALDALIDAGVTAADRVVLVLNADEEAGGGLGMDHVRDVLGSPIDAAVIGEASGVRQPYETLYVAARGALRFTLVASGTAGHTSLVREPGMANAADRLRDALGALRERLTILREIDALHGPADLIVVRLDAGRGWGVIPDRACADVELRVVPGVTQAAAEADLATALAGLDVRIAYAPGSMRWVEPSAVAPDHPVVRAAAAAWEDVHGGPPRLGCFPGGTDGRSLSERGIPTIPGVGPGTLLRAHGADEHVTVDELVAAAQIYALTAHAFLSEDRASIGDGP